MSPNHTNKSQQKRLKISDAAPVTGGKPESSGFTQKMSNITNLAGTLSGTGSIYKVLLERLYNKNNVIKSPMMIVYFG